MAWLVLLALWQSPPVLADEGGNDEQVDTADTGEPVDTGEDEDAQPPGPPREPTGTPAALLAGEQGGCDESGAGCVTAPAGGLAAGLAALALFRRQS